MRKGKLLRTRLFGYKKSDVNAYLMSLNESAQEKLNAQYDKQDALVKENHALKSKVEVYEERIRNFEEQLREYRESKEFISKAILSAEQRAEEILAKAKQEAESLLQDAQTEAEAVLTEAEAVWDETEREIGRRQAGVFKRPESILSERLKKFRK